jgi:hypothetical protein
VFLRNSTKAFFRQILAVQGRKDHKGKNIFVEPTLGLPPLVLGPALEAMSDAPMEVPDKVELEGEMKSQITLPYVQTLPKIAFHFVLAHFHFTGFESEFNDLKRFVYSGAVMNRARIVEEILLPQRAPKEARLRQWSHILTAEFNSQGFVSRMQFFAGPRLGPVIWQVDLGPNPSRVLPDMAVRLRFFYYEQPDPSGYSPSVPTSLRQV